MIRLVTQFDAPHARASVATPTCCCAGCSCCCCCVVTLVSSSIYTAVSAQGIHRSSVRQASERVLWASPLPGLLAFFAGPIAILVLYLFAAAGEGALIFALAAWFGLVGLAYRGAGAQRPWIRALAVVVATSVALVLEFLVWLSAVDVE